MKRRRPRATPNKKAPKRRFGKLPKSMDALALKSDCYAVIDQVAATDSSILITKDGKPLVRLRAHRPENSLRTPVR